MTKNLLLAIFWIVAMQVHAQENFTIRINEQEIDVALDSTYPVEIEGKTFYITVMQKDTLVYETDYFSFKYLKDNNVSEIEVEEGINQAMLMNAEGSGFFVQTYTMFNPKFMEEMMLHELTKESLSYGYQMEKEHYTRQLISGEEINILRATLTYRGEENIYEVTTIGEKDEGILIVSVIMNNQWDMKGKKAVSLMWNTLSYRDDGHRNPEVNGFDSAFYKNLSSTELPDDILIVVDGVPTKDGLNIDPARIESISILKDESATEIYGERGKNGVILIELKKE